MRLLLTLSLIIVGVTASFAQDWTSFGRDAKGVEHYYKIHSRNSIGTMAWWKHSSKSEAIKHKGKVKTYQNVEVMELFRIYCDDKHYYLMQMVYRDSNGEPILTDQPIVPIDLGFAVPGTIGENFVDAACK
jgi:hypothetical protein